MEIPAPAAGVHHADPRAGRHDGRGRHRARRRREQHERSRVGTGRPPRSRRSRAAPAPAPAAAEATPPSWYAAMPPDMNTAKEQYTPRAATGGSAPQPRRQPPKPWHATAINGCRRPCAASRPSTGSISTAVSGSGRNGRITRRNVLEFIQRSRTAPAQAAPRRVAAACGGSSRRRCRRPRLAPRRPRLAPPAGAKTVPFTRIRKLTAEHMVRSKATSPHVLQAVEVDFYRVDQRAQIRARRVEDEARLFADVLAVHRATPCAARSRTFRT